MTVTIDGAAVPMEALAGPRLLDPGSHGVFASSTNGGTAETKIDLKEGEVRQLELKIVPTVTQAVPTSAALPKLPATPTGETTKHISVGPLVYSSFGIAAAALAVGGVTGLWAFSKASSVKGACDGTTCPNSVDGDLQSGRTLANVSTIAFVVAGVGVATGVFGIALARRNEGSLSTALSFKPWIGLGNAGLQGAF